MGCWLAIAKSDMSKVSICTVMVMELAVVTTQKEERSSFPDGSLR